MLNPKPEVDVMSGADGPVDDTRQETYLKTAFLERVAHELRGPAGVIQGALQELEFALGPEAETHRALFDMARRGVQRIVRTADRLQQTGQCERGSIPVQLSRCDLVALVRKSVTEAERLEARKKISVAFELPEEPLHAEVDTRWFGVALFEIASNAIRHARERVEVRLVEQDGALEVTFRDDSTSGATFEPLRFVAPRESRGLGLALAIVRDVIEAHGGELEIESGGSGASARGSQVRLRLPRRTAPEAKARAWL